MPALLLRFAIVLENFAIRPYDPVSGERRHGPLFHKWLPDGERDALELNVDETDAELRVWFEQNGYLDNGRVKFDYERKELDSKIIAEQPILDAGPLIGTLKLPNVSDEVIAAMQENRADDPAYVAFGRRAAVIIYRSVSRLLNVLRTNYGQYWIDELKEWNPREQSLGSYFSLVVQTKWGLVEGGTWSDFLPESPQLLSRGENSAEAYRELMTQQDWRDLQKNLNEGYEPKFGAELLSKTHEQIEQDDLRNAVVHAMVTLEIGLNEFLHRKTRMNKVLADNLHSFVALPISARLVAVATLSGILSAHQVESALKLVEVHHKIIRDGWEPPATAKEEIRHVMQTVAALLSGPNFKFPSYFTEAPVVEILEPQPAV